MKFDIFQCPLVSVLTLNSDLHTAELDLFIKHVTMFSLIENKDGMFSKFCRFPQRRICCSNVNLLAAVDASSSISISESFLEFSCSPTIVSE